MILRPYQQKLVSAAVNALSAHDNTLAVAATGAGKTICLAAVAKEIGGKQLVMQHRWELLQQNMHKFRMVNPKAMVSVWSAGAKSFRGDTTFAMVQSLVGYVERMPRLDLIIADEAHHCAAPSWTKIIDAAREKNPDCKIIGFTATPSRSDNKSLGKIFDNVCDKISTRQLVSLGFLVPPRAFVVKIDEISGELAAIKDVSSWGEQTEAARVFDKEVVTSEVIRNYRKYADGRIAVVFATTVAHAENVAKAFTAAGIPAACIYGDMTKQQRESVFRKVARGQIKVVTNCMVLTEGWDFPPVSCVILLRKCSEKGAMIQMIGRGLRTVNPEEYPGVKKTDCIILDFGTSMLAAGNIDAAIDLDDKPEPKGGEAPTKECPNCGVVLPANTAKCPNCGYIFTKETEAATHVDLTEFEILGRSQWRYIDLFGNGHARIAVGFTAWAGVFTSDDKTFFAIGRKKRCRVRNMYIGDCAQALAAADDFMRMNETEPASGKFSFWLDQPATPKQIEMLSGQIYNPGMTTKYRASAALCFNYAFKDITRIIGLGA